MISVRVCINEVAIVTNGDMSLVNPNSASWISRSVMEIALSSLISCKKSYRREIFKKNFTAAEVVISLDEWSR